MGVQPLSLSKDLSSAFLGGLLSVCRADGDVDNDEFAALRGVAESLDWGGAIESLIFSRVTPRSLADTVARSKPQRSPFRAIAHSDPDAIGSTFVSTALRLARAGDGTINDQETRLIRRFAHALGCASDELTSVEFLLSDPP